MAENLAAPRPDVEREWFIVGRLEEFEGEGRANLLRLIGITAFYAVELINYYGVDLAVVQIPPIVDRPFHLAMTFLTLAWAMLCVSVLLCRRQRIFPHWLKYVSTGCDLVLLTSILMLADGPRSPLIIVYLLVIGLAGLRFSLPLVWFATGGAIAGYVFLLGFARWGAVPGWEKPDQIVPRYYQIIFVLALVFAGIVLGQVIRRVRRLAEEYAARLAEARGETP